MRISLVVTLAGVVMLPSFRPAAGQDSPPPALRVLIQSFQDVWNAHDASRVADLFTDDADQIMGLAELTTGRPAIRRWWDARFAGMERGRTITLTLSSARLVSPDVAVINTIAATAGRDPQGQPLPATTDRGTWIVVSKAGNWRIAALRTQQQAERASSR